MKVWAANRSLIMAIMASTALCFSGCIINLGFTGVQGSGVSKTEAREVEAYHSIDVSGAVKVNFVQGDDASVTLTTDDNLVELITTEVKDGVLVVGSKEQYSSQCGVELDITNPDLKMIDMSGACSLNTDSLNGDDLELDLSGACGVTIAGTVNAINADVSGACKLSLQDLAAKSATIEMSGASSAKVNASEKLDVDLSGACKVSYKGDPKVTKSTSGVCKVKKM